MKDNIITTAKETIQQEINALIILKERINEEFSKSVELILNAKGKVVVCGIGKSAHIGNKIVASLNSTGTPSQFLHAAEAIHGDLGLVGKEDVVICISNSGTSSEIEQIVPLLKNYAKALIAMTANANSNLAKQADAWLDTSIEKEAEPNNLAPTTSTTVQLALGDALIVALIKAREFTAEDFAKYHPGGALGKKLLWKVEQLVEADKKPNVPSNATIKEIIMAISYSSHGITAVTDNNEVIGVITDGDLRRMLMQEDTMRNYENVQAKDIMSKKPKTIQKDTLAYEAFSTMTKNNIGQLIVLDKGNYFGIIDLHSLLKEGFK